MGDLHSFAWILECRVNIGVEEEPFEVNPLNLPSLWRCDGTRGGIGNQVERDSQRWVKHCCCCTMEMLAWNVYNSVCVEYRGACPSELPPLRDGILLGVSDLVGDGFLGHETFRWKFSRSLVNVCPHDTDADNEWRWLVGLLWWIIVLHFIHKVYTRVFVCNAYKAQTKWRTCHKERGRERETESKMCK